MELFDKKSGAQKAKLNAKGELFAPLADRMRPQKFDDFVGQEEIIAPNKALRKVIDNIKVSGGQIPSMIFWGPPGSGKTTLANLVANEVGCEFITFSAVTSGIKEIKEVMERAKYNFKHNNQNTILFIDEIHRFNKAQQDAFLPYVEKGVISLIGATTENPSFELNSALLSRCRVYILKALAEKDIIAIIHGALNDKERGLGQQKIKLDAEAEKYLINIANGDARVALNLLELTAQSLPLPQAGLPRGAGEQVISKPVVESAAQKKILLYDRAGEEHYNLISALHKSLRGSDVQAALYWLGRMLEAGEDPLYIARRIVRFASEDIGNSDPQALVISLAAKEVVDFIGMPEADNALAQAVIYLATAPKSNAVYKAYGKVKQDVAKTIAMPVPLHLRNPVTDLMGKIGYGKDYKYAHKFPQSEYGGFAQQEHLPDNLKGTKYYEPSDYGFEKEIKKRMEYWDRLRNKKE